MVPFSCFNPCQLQQAHSFSPLVFAVFLISNPSAKNLQVPSKTACFDFVPSYLMSALPFDLQLENR